MPPKPLLGPLTRLAKTGEDLRPTIAVLGLAAVGLRNSGGVTSATRLSWLVIVLGALGATHPEVRDGLGQRAWLFLEVSLICWLTLPAVLAAARGAPDAFLRSCAGLLEARGSAAPTGHVSARALALWLARRMLFFSWTALLWSALVAWPSSTGGWRMALALAAYSGTFSLVLAVLAGLSQRLGRQRGGLVLLGGLVGLEATGLGLTGSFGALLRACLAI